LWVITLLEVKTSQIARQVICGTGVEMPNRGIGVVAGRRHILGALVVVVAGLKLRIVLVPTVRRNKPTIVADLALGALAVTVVLTVTTFIVAIVLATTSLATGGLSAGGSGIALTSIRASVARARLIGAGLARSTSRELGSARPAGVGVEAGTRDDIRRGGPACRLILLLLKSLERQDVRVKFIIRHRLVTEHKSRCNGVEFFAESGDDVVDELVTGERRAGCCHDIAEGLHLLHVLGSGHPLLAKRLELATNMTNVGATMRAIEPVHGGPDVHG
jgi:hypothetical protein